MFLIVILYIYSVRGVPNFGRPLSRDPPSFYPINRNFFLGNPKYVKLLNFTNSERKMYWNLQKPPFPTGAFFTNAVVPPKEDGESEPVQAFPYIYTFRENGIK